jgi:hypothetical protein
MIIHIAVRPECANARFSFALGTIIAENKRIRCFGERDASQWQVRYDGAGMRKPYLTGKV